MSLRHWARRSWKNSGSGSSGRLWSSRSGERERRVRMSRSTIRQATTGPGLQPTSRLRGGERFSIPSVPCRWCQRLHRQIQPRLIPWNLWLNWPFRLYRPGHPRRGLQSGKIQRCSRGQRRSQKAFSMRCRIRMRILRRGGRRWLGHSPRRRLPSPGGAQEGLVRCPEIHGNGRARGSSRSLCIF